MKNPIVKINDAGKVVTTSRDVAAYFGKEHRRVLQDIKELDCSEKFGEHNFVLSNYLTTQGKELPMYEITRDGFTFLAMGYTGKEAARFKEAYITAFNKMEATLLNSAAPHKAVDGMNEYRLRKAEELKAKATEIHLRNMEKLFTLLPHLGQESRQAYAAKYIGVDVVPMPKLERRTLSATEVGDAVGISANKVGRLTNEHGLKTSQYGVWILDKSASSAKQVETFRYYDAVIPAIRHLLND